MTDSILLSRENHIGLITLNRISALNALTLPMILSLQEQLSAWENDNAIKAVVIRASEGKAFCAGGDVRWLYDSGKANTSHQMEFFWHEYRLNHFIHHYKKPYIALMDGITMGGGVGISLHGSHPIATENFSFAMPETGIGFFPDIGASYLLARCPGHFGDYLALSGDRIKAGDAYALNLVKHVITANQKENVLDALISSTFIENPYTHIDNCIQSFCTALSAPLLDVEEIIEQSFSKNTVEEIVLELIKIKGPFAESVHNTLLQKSPLSLKVTRKQMEKARHLSMAECIKMDFRLVYHFMHDHDFYEGVRALLVDKDKSPRWQPSALEEISAAQIDKYFKCEFEELALIN